jgi:hypothetical protein
MKKLLFLLLVPVLSFAQQKACWSSNGYTIVDDYGVHKFTGTATLCIHDNIIAYYCDKTGLRTLEVVLIDSKAVKNGIKSIYISTDHCFEVTIIAPGRVEIQESCGPGSRQIVMDKTTMSSLTFEDLKAKK